MKNHFSQSRCVRKLRPSKRGKSIGLIKPLGTEHFSRRFLPPLFPGSLGLPREKYLSRVRLRNGSRRINLLAVCSDHLISICRCRARWSCSSRRFSLRFSLNTHGLRSPTNRMENNWSGDSDVRDHVGYRKKLRAKVTYECHLDFQMHEFKFPRTLMRHWDALSGESSSPPSFIHVISRVPFL